MGFSIAGDSRTQQGYQQGWCKGDEETQGIVGTAVKPPTEESWNSCGRWCSRPGIRTSSYTTMWKQSWSFVFTVGYMGLRKYFPLIFKVYIVEDLDNMKKKVKITCCYRLHVCVLPKFICWNVIPMVIRRWGFWGDYIMRMGPSGWD